MNFIASIDTVIFGKPYAQGAIVDISGWTRKQILHHLNNGIIQAGQISGGNIGGAVIFQGSEVSTAVDENGVLVVTIEVQSRELSWLSDVDTAGRANGYSLVWNSTAGQWKPQLISAPAPATTLNALTDVDTAGRVEGSVLEFDAATGQWMPGQAVLRELLDLLDVTADGIQDGQTLIYDYSESRFVPGTPNGSPGPPGPVTWDTPVPWTSTLSAITGPPATLVTYEGSAYVAIDNSVNVLPTNPAYWRLVVARGEQGDEGDPGPASTVPGPPGASTDLNIGTVTTRAAGLGATATVTGEAPTQYLNLGLPRGDTGDPGPPGPALIIPAGGTYSIDGSAQLMSGNKRLYNDTGVTLTISKVRIAAGTAPVGSDLIIDIHKGGTTIFSTQANRPRLNAGQSASLSGAPNTTSWADGEYLTLDVDQVGSTTPGSDIVITVVCS